MKAGDIFEHPVKDTGKAVKLVAVRGEICANAFSKPPLVASPAI